MRRQHIAIHDRPERITIEQRCRRRTQRFLRRLDRGEKIGHRNGLQCLHGRRGDPKCRSTHSVSASARSFVRSRTAAPLWMIARWNNPAARGIASSVLTLPPPPDSPNIVTLPGSPPNAGDIVAHPFQRGDHVQRAGIARMPESLAADRREVEMAENIQPLIDVHHDDVVFASPTACRAAAAHSRCRKRTHRHGTTPSPAAPRCGRQPGVQTLTVRQSSVSGDVSGGPEKSANSARGTGAIPACGARPEKLRQSRLPDHGAGR